MSADNKPLSYHLGLGGNVGDVVAAMQAAIDRLDGLEDASVRQVSRVYRTPAWGKTDQPDFFNACVEYVTGAEPLALLETVLATERGLGRIRDERWGPRTLDIDILLQGERRVEKAQLKIPHPHLTGRAFVLVPLAEIAPDLRVEGRRIADWLEAADQTGISRSDQRLNLPSR